MPKRFELWLCASQAMTRLAPDLHDDVAHAVEAAKEHLAHDARLLKVEVHAGSAHVCSIGRGWTSKSRKHFGDRAA